MKNVSTACEGLCKWIRAMDIYDRVAKIVAPKQQALAVAELELADQMEKLNSKRTELQVILDKLRGLNDFFAEKSRQKKNLEDEIDNCEKKLDRYFVDISIKLMGFRFSRFAVSIFYRCVLFFFLFLSLLDSAETLLSGLSVEKIRWSEIANTLRIALDNVIGDVLLSSAFIAYLGSFPQRYRDNLIKLWIEKCTAYEIPCTEDFKLHQTLSDSTEIRNWTTSKLPTDNYAIESAIIVRNSNRYPLLIDPQGKIISI